MKREKLTLGWRGKSEPVPDIVFVEEVGAEPAAPAPIQLAGQALALWDDLSPLDKCLELWKAWMSGDADRDLGTKTMSGLVGDGDGHGVDLYEAQQASDNRIGAATDAMIESLSRLHFWAIYKSCSIATPWKFPNAEFLVVAVEAREELAKKLRNNVCTGILF